MGGKASSDGLTAACAACLRGSRVLRMGVVNGCKRSEMEVHMKGLVVVGCDGV